MIELPEAYTLARQIDAQVKGRTIVNAEANRSPHKFAWYTGDPAGYGERLAGRTIKGANPGTGHTCGGNVEIEAEDKLVVFSTPARYFAPGEKRPDKHQLILELDDGSALTFTVQMWGAMLCLDVNGSEPLKGFGTGNPTPMDKAFTPEYFRDMAAKAREGKSVSAKALLATEQRIPGFGNGVLQDVLFHARIHPKRKLDALSGDDIDRLYDCVTQTVFAMTAAGGRDTERDLYGCPGGYKTLLSSKTAGDPCPVCGGEITRQAYMGGNVYFCAACQPIA